MTQESFPGLVQYRIDRALEVLEDAKLLANAKRWRSCVNRLYYSCFYAASALLAKCDMSSSKHAGVLSLFNLHFVKTGKIAKDAAEIYNDLFDNRQESDYTDFIILTEEQVLPQVEKAQAFIKMIETLISKKPL
jgi:uncharacterized protein (UPF0332 family)